LSLAWRHELNDETENKEGMGMKFYDLMYAQLLSAYTAIKTSCHCRESCCVGFSMSHWEKQ
jgi:hypothetical protein